MAKRILRFAVIALVLGGCVQTTPQPQVETATPVPTPGPALVWSDEFVQPDGSPPDPAKWNYSKGGGGWGNGELEYYTDSIENAYIENGMLVIQAIQETYMGRNYTSARLNTLAKGQWKYGRIEIRAKLPNTQGIWPAFWLLPKEITHYGDWPVSGEIDIMEFIGSEPGRVYGALHFGNPHELVSGYYELPTDQTFSDAFHIFTLEWEPDQFRWYVDGNLYHSANEWFTSKTNSPFPAPFDQEFYLILNVAVGGNWPGSPDETSLFPQRMYVDYVRVYQETP